MEKTDKDVLRKQVSDQRKNLSLAARTAADQRITRILVDLAELAAASSVCTYVSLPQEADTKETILTLLHRNKTVVVPRMKGSLLTLHTIRSWQDLVPGAFSILEPKQTCPAVHISGVDLFVIPGIAFDRRGHRIGWGKGYYDELLKNISVPRVALAYSFQVLADIPHTAYDMSVTHIITENEVIRCLP